MCNIDCMILQNSLHRWWTLFSGLFASLHVWPQRRGNRPCHWQTVQTELRKCRESILTAVCSRSCTVPAEQASQDDWGPALREPAVPQQLCNYWRYCHLSKLTSITPWSGCLFSSYFKNTRSFFILIKVFLFPQGATGSFCRMWTFQDLT